MHLGRSGSRITAIAALVTTTIAVTALSTIASGQVPAGVAADPALLADLMREGEGVYRICAACHGSAGEGLPGGQEAGPPLAGNVALSAVGGLLRQIINGGTYMPGLGGSLSDRRIAAVATYVRNSFGNTFGIVTEEQVAAAR